MEWDVGNWWRAITFWEFFYDPVNVKGKKVLDIGGRNGGISLYWALKGADVTCSDIEAGGFRHAKSLHEKYGVAARVKYEVVDATDISYEDEFDIVCFKSVMGGVGYGDNFMRQRCMMGNIEKALKKGGMCFFVENAKGTGLHQFMRTHVRMWGGVWRYIGVDEIVTLAEGFSEVHFATYGFLGLFRIGRISSVILSGVDVGLDRFLKPQSRYIVSCVMKK